MEMASEISTVTSQPRLFFATSCPLLKRPILESSRLADGFDLWLKEDLHRDITRGLE